MYVSLSAITDIGYCSRILAVCKSCVSISDLYKCGVSTPGFRHPFLHWARRNPRRYHAFSWGRDADRSFLFLITAHFPSPLWSPRQSLALNYSVIAWCRRIRNIRLPLSAFTNIVQHLLTKRCFAHHEFKSPVFSLLSSFANPIRPICEQCKKSWLTYPKMYVYCAHGCNGFRNQVQNITAVPIIMTVFVNFI